MKKNTAYTIWTLGGTSDKPLRLSVEADPDKDVWTGFSTRTALDGHDGYGVLASWEWDEEDPSSATYYFCVSGDEIGSTFVFHYQRGEVSDNSDSTYFRLITSDGVLTGYEGTVPENLLFLNVEVGDTAFSGCSTLRTVTLSDELLNWRPSAFYDCVSLTAIHFSDGDFFVVSDGVFLRPTRKR